MIKCSCGTTDSPVLRLGFGDLDCPSSRISHLPPRESQDWSDLRRESLPKWLGQTITFHLHIFRCVHWNLKLMVFLRQKKPVLLNLLLLIPLHGLLAFVLVVTICRAVCYFMPCDPLILRRKKTLEGVIGMVCPCFLFGKNAEFLGSGTLAGSCMTHFILWGLVNSLCCLFSGGILAFFPGAMVACGYRKALRRKYKLQEVPCGDLTTHLFCHLCAICQEYREIRERSNGSTPLVWTDTTAPTIQTMHPTGK